MTNANLLKVSKPARYIGGELNSIIKSDGVQRLSFCLIFPDIYEIGSSHIGYRLLYELVNKSDSIACERFFAPWVDMLDMLSGEAFKSLESDKPLKEFDLLGFSMHYEMCYTTVLAILKYSGVSIKSAERAEDEPIIIAGGSCTYNPAPLLPFIDAFYIGEGDIGLRGILEGIERLKKKGAKRREILEYLNSFSFMYVPQVDIDKVVKRDIYTGFSASVGASEPIVPLMPAIQDRVAVEIARGCTAGCRFCQAGVIYRPVRERSVELISNDACRQIKSSGHLEVSLLSLSTGDYSELEPLVTKLNSELNPLNVSLSTPSLRADSVSESLFKEISKLRKSGFTIAPEAGTERMRKVINKNLSEEEILQAVITAAENGYNGVKLYFMIGLPFETDEDILGIASLAQRIKKSVRRGGFDISVAVSHFVPKPHTPFERFGQVNKLELERRMYMLKDELKKLKLKFKFHDTRMSAIEALFSRGSSDISKLLEYTLDNGFYLDAWDDFFEYDRWVEACAESGIDLAAATERGYAKNERTPWWNIDTGVSAEFYESEVVKAENCIETGDCRRGECYDCGVCDFVDIMPVNAPPADVTVQNTGNYDKIYEKYELTYEKLDGAKFLSALELGRVFSHCLRVAGADLKFSQGFNPLPRIVLYLPLPVGISGENEKVVIEACSEDTQYFLEILNKKLPKGMRAKKMIKAESMKTGADFISTYRLNDIARVEFEKAIAENDANYERTSKSGDLKLIELSKFLIKYDNGRVTLKADATGGFNLLELFKKRGTDIADIDIARETVDIA